MSAYPVVNRQYFGTGPVATVYGFQISGAMMGHFISTLVAGIIIQFIGYIPAFILSMAFSSLGVAIILTLETTKRQLIPDWEDQLPPEARTPYRQCGPGDSSPGCCRHRGSLRQRRRRWQLGRLGKCRHSGSHRHSRRKPESSSV